MLITQRLTFTQNLGGNVTNLDCFVSGESCAVRPRIDSGKSVISLIGPDLTTNCLIAARHHLK